MSSIPIAWQQVAERSRYRCSFCQSQRRLMGVSLTIDHITPQSLGGTTELDNLCQACWEGKLIKGDRTMGIDLQTGMPVRLFIPNQQRWSDHFRWSGLATAHAFGPAESGREWPAAHRER